MGRIIVLYMANIVAVKITFYNRQYSKIINFERKENIMSNFLKNLNEQLIEICKTLKIKRMYAFGSVVGENFNKESDVDFLICFSDEISITEYTENYFELHKKLNFLLNRKIDIVTERTLSNPYFIKSINETKRLIYEA